MIQYRDALHPDCFDIRTLYFRTFGILTQNPDSGNRGTILVLVIISNQSFTIVEQKLRAPPGREAQKQN